MFKNSYPRDLVDKCMKEFLGKTLDPKTVVSATPKKVLVITLPYLGKLSFQIHTRSNRILNNKFPDCNIWFAFKTSNFFKDKIPSPLRSNFVCKVHSDGFSATYYDKTKRHFKVIMCKHLEILTLTRKRVKGDDDSAIKENILFSIKHLILKIS